MKKVCLGGTCNGSTWRDALIKDLQIDYFSLSLGFSQHFLTTLKDLRESLYMLNPKDTYIPGFFVNLSCEQYNFKYSS